MTAVQQLASVTTVGRAHTLQQSVSTAPASWVAYEEAVSNRRRVPAPCSTQQLYLNLSGGFPRKAGRAAHCGCKLVDSLAKKFKFVISSSMQLWQLEAVGTW